MLWDEDEALLREDELLWELKLTELELPELEPGDAQ